MERRWINGWKMDKKLKGDGQMDRRWIRNGKEMDKWMEDG